MPESWLDLPGDTPFGLANLPYGVFSRPDGAARRIGVAVGDHVLDLSAAAEAAGTGFAGLVQAEVLNPLMAAGRPVWREVRSTVTGWLTDQAHRDLVTAHLVPLSEVELHLPVEVADYVDFYSSEQHAVNANRIFRPKAPGEVGRNWRSLPVGYHGRAGTVVVSGTPVRRPHGLDGAGYGPSARLDFEAEVGFVVGVPSELGTPVGVGDYAAHVFGVCLVNDWSARDIQRWESTPLGPFLGKSFLTSVSPWVVPLDALAHAEVAPPVQDPAPVGYLREPGRGLDLALEVRLNGHLLTSPPFATQYWTAAQQLAHLTANGAALRTGDLYASGTVSGPDRGQWGSLLELSWNGAEPVELPDGTRRTFLEDGDEVTITATAPAPDGSRIGFGAVTGRVVPGR